VIWLVSRARWSRAASAVRINVLAGKRGQPRERRGPSGPVITITADHPVWGDARVVRRTARYGNVAGADAVVRQQV
jgi:hypothetical protein